jgi:hypothetical protein
MIAAFLARGFLVLICAAAEVEREGYVRSLDSSLDPAPKSVAVIISGQWSFSEGGEQQLSSSSKHFIQPLRKSLASVSVFVCLDEANEKHRKIVNAAYSPSVLVFMMNSCDGLDLAQQQECKRATSGAEAADDDRLHASHQFYRMSACFRLVENHQRLLGSSFDFVIGARPDLLWVDNFPSNAFSSTHVTTRYSRAAGVKDVALAKLTKQVRRKKKAWFKV